MVNPEFMATDFFEISIFLICFVLLGRWLENIAKGRTSSAITKLLSLKGSTAVVVTLDQTTAEPVSEQEIDVDLVEKHDVLKVVPGANIPTDGKIVERRRVDSILLILLYSGVIVRGTSSVNEAMITGESMPVTKKLGDKVLGGTTNIQGLLYVEAVHVGDETAIGKIAKLVRES